MGVLSKSQGKEKVKTFGKIPSRGDFGKKKSYIKKKSVKSLASSEDKDYLEWLKNQEYCCFVCGKINFNDPIEWHHVKLRSSDKKDHTRLIPLCGAEHHRLGKDLSPHGSPKKWRETYTIESQLLYAEKIHKQYLKGKL